MNPFTAAASMPFFGKDTKLQGFISSRVKPSSYGRMLENRIKNRRMKNRMARKSRRRNQIAIHNLHCKYFPY